MMSVALTGNVGSGKSTVARLWEERGVPVLRADELAREVVAPGTEGLAAVVEVFGPGVLAPDGVLDREALRRRVFADPAERTLLEGLLHPRIRALRERWLAGLGPGGHPMAVAEIPLLFETGLQGEFDVVVLVDAPRGERLRRLVADRGLGEEEARRIMAAQAPVEEKRPLAHYLLENGGTLGDLEQRALALLDLLRARARRGAPQAAEPPGSVAPGAQVGGGDVP